MKKKENKIKAPKENFQLPTGQNCQHQWVPLVARVGKKNVPTSLFTCLKCGEMKVGKHTIRISRYRLDMGGLPITTLGGIVLVAALSGDGTYSGITEAGTAGATLAFGDLVYLQTADSRWELASADNAAAGFNFKLGICVLAAANDGSATTVLLFGKVRADAAFPALTVGAPVFMSTTAGDIQVAAPTGTTDAVRVIGYGNTGDELYFFPDQTYVELV